MTEQSSYCYPVRTCNASIHWMQMHELRLGTSLPHDKPHEKGGGVEGGR